MCRENKMRNLDEETEMSPTVTDLRSVILCCALLILVTPSLSGQFRFPAVFILIPLC